MPAKVSSYYGKRETLNGRNWHDGVDLAVPVGTPIYTNKELTVTQATTQTGYGNIVYARDNLGTEYRFAHLDSIPSDVKPGAVLAPGSQIAYSGVSGTEKDGTATSTGAHLHYEVRRGGKSVDPLTTIDPATGKPYIANASFDQSGRSLITSDITKDKNYSPNDKTPAPVQKQDPTGRSIKPKGLKPDANQNPAESNRLNNTIPDAPIPGIRAPLINPLLQLGDR